MSYSRIATITCDKETGEDCAIEAALSILGGKWKLKIYKSLRLGNALRFSEIKDRLDPVSDKTLSAQLREMEEDHLLIRAVFPEVPPRVEYCLTPFGRSLEDVFVVLEQWGSNFIRMNRGLQPAHNTTTIDASL